MGLQFRRSLDGDSISAVKDFKLDATYAATAKIYDLVKFNGSGDVVLAATNDVSVLGVLEGFNIQQKGETVLYGKVRTDGNSIYEAPYTGGTPVVGDARPVTMTSGGQVNAGATATPVFKVVAVNTARSTADVVITGRQLV
jgi:hypothetical protein